MEVRLGITGKTTVSHCKTVILTPSVKSLERMTSGKHPSGGITAIVALDSLGGSQCSGDCEEFLRKREAGSTEGTGIRADHAGSQFGPYKTGPIHQRHLVRDP